MKNTLFYLFILVAAISCTPKNEEVKDEQVDIGPPQKALDSVANTEQDAVVTDEVDSDTFLPLPQPVLQLLAQKYPGYKQPVLTENAKREAGKYEQGPILITGNFTNDTHQDYALQLQQDKDIVILAITDTGEGNPTIHELKRDILFNERGVLKSMYYLYQSEAGAELQNAENGENLKSDKEAVAVGLADNVTIYVYSSKQFKPYNTSSR